MNEAGLVCLMVSDRPVDDEYVQYAGIFARGVEGCREDIVPEGEETRLVWETGVGSWSYQEGFIGGI